MIALLVWSALGATEPIGPLQLVNPGPLYSFFYHTPTLSPRVLTPGSILISMGTELANIFEADQSPKGRTIWMDTEILLLRPTLRLGLFSNLDLSLSFLFSSASGGFLDAMIFEFHDTFGLPQRGRERIERNQHDLFFTDSFESGRLADDRGRTMALSYGAVSMRLQLLKQPLALSLLGTLALPSGEPERLLSTDVPQVAGAVLMERKWRSYILGGGVEMVSIPDLPMLGTLIADSFLLDLFLTQEFQLAQWVSLHLELRYFRPPYRGGGLDSLTNHPVAVAFGASFRPTHALIMRFSSTEDLLPSGSVDIAFNLGIEWTQ